MDITNLKLKLGFKNSELRDDVLVAFKTDAYHHICGYIGVPFTSFPLELDYIADNIASAAFNQANSEGITSEMTDITRFNYEADIYSKWNMYLDQWLNTQNDVRRRSIIMR